MGIFAFRADASTFIGTGHVMRCLSLADALVKNGHEVLFFSREQDGHLGDFIEQRASLRLIRLARPASTAHALTGYAKWLGVEQSVDARDTLHALGALSLREAPTWIIDHYGIGREWETIIRMQALTVAVIDDLANREHDADLLIDVNLRSDEENPYRTLCPANCRFLLGPRYAPLGESFAPHATQVFAPAALPLHGLIYFGGTDATGETLKTLRAVGELRRTDMTFDVVIGKNNERAQEISTLLAQLPQVRGHFTHVKMMDLMGRAHFAIGAGGTTAWERCRMGLPAIVTAVAENQVSGAVAMAENLQHLYLGTSSEATPEKIKNALLFLIDHPALRSAISKRNRALVDGRGTERIVRTLARPSLRLRPATLMDSAPLLAWRNAPINRALSFSPHEISGEMHAQWFKKILADPSRLLLIGETSEGPVGVLRYDVTGDSAVISVYMVPGFHGRGMGAALLEAGSQWVRNEHVEVTSITAEVRPDNLASQAVFKEAGFQLKNMIFQRRLP